MTTVPSIRIQARNVAPVRADGSFVLYWMIAARRLHWNFGLQHAVDYAKELKKPLVICEPLRLGYQWASDRLHRFILDGMAEHAKQLDTFKSCGVYYYPYVERKVGEGKGLLAALARQACLVITDDYPCFFLPRMVESAGRQLNVRLEQVDSNGLLPLRAVDRVFTTARSFRLALHRQLPVHLGMAPKVDPLADVRLPVLRSIPSTTLKRWPPADSSILEGNSLATLPIDHRVGPVDYQGGTGAAKRVLARFQNTKLGKYIEDSNHPDAECRSGLSPYLHFGHVSSHEIFAAIADGEGWSVESIEPAKAGSREGWWGMSPAAEAFLDQLLTWRELGFNMCHLRPDYDQLESLPAWAQATLNKHAADPRQHAYRLGEFETAQTHDPLWNASQRQLVSEGRIHNYLRMLWGKKILEWTASPQEALEVIIELNNKYAVDGRDPNSYSGIFWTLGRYDRPWGPERPIFGTIRYMSSANSQKKLRLREYLERYSD